MRKGVMGMREGKGMRGERNEKEGRRRIVNLLKEKKGIISIKGEHRERWKNWYKKS